ncbi:hypothetical protein ACT80S_10870 [Ramlibacter sp. MAHUQ-53]|uniref:hypothetical protein n=1 Tax=unclassified Ramlibacter TaxID=2617605 RepID=UPI00362AD2BB
MGKRTTGRQAPGTGKVANDHNQAGQAAATQKNEAPRTPRSRHDRDTHLGSDNQSRTRQGGPGSGQR